MTYVLTLTVLLLVSFQSSAEQKTPLVVPEGFPRERVQVLDQLITELWVPFRGGSRAKLNPKQEDVVTEVFEALTSAPNWFHDPKRDQQLKDALRNQAERVVRFDDRGLLGRERFELGSAALLREAQIPLLGEDERIGARADLICLAVQSYFLARFSRPSLIELHEFALERFARMRDFTFVPLIIPVALSMLWPSHTGVAVFVGGASFLAYNLYLKRTLRAQSARLNRRQEPLGVGESARARIQNEFLRHERISFGTHAIGSKLNIQDLEFAEACERYLER